VKEKKIIKDKEEMESYTERNIKASPRSRQTPTHHGRGKKWRRYRTVWAWDQNKMPVNWRTKTCGCPAHFQPYIYTV
jgi:hypothetical protein